VKEQTSLQNVLGVILKKLNSLTRDTLGGPLYPFEVFYTIHPSSEIRPIAALGLFKWVSLCFGHGSAENM
jgi:hypothetical protein